MTRRELGFEINDNGWMKREPARAAEFYEPFGNGPVITPAIDALLVAGKLGAEFLCVQPLIVPHRGNSAPALGWSAEACSFNCHKYVRTALRNQPGMCKQVFRHAQNQRSPLPRHEKSNIKPM